MIDAFEADLENSLAQELKARVALKEKIAIRLNPAEAYIVRQCIRGYATSEADPEKRFVLTNIQQILESALSTHPAAETAFLFDRASDLKIETDTE